MNGVARYGKTRVFATGIFFDRHAKDFDGRVAYENVRRESAVHETNAADFSVGVDEKRPFVIGLAGVRVRCEVSKRKTKLRLVDRRHDGAGLHRVDGVGFRVEEDEFVVAHEKEVLREHENVPFRFEKPRGAHGGGVHQGRARAADLHAVFRTVGIVEPRHRDGFARALEIATEKEGERLRGFHFGKRTVCAFGVEDGKAAAKRVRFAVDEVARRIAVEGAERKEFRTRRAVGEVRDEPGEGRERNQGKRQSGPADVLNHGRVPL